MRILFLINSLAFGGAERQTVDLVNGLDNSTFKKFFIYLNRNESLLAKLDKENINLIQCLDRKYKIDFSVLYKLHQIVTKNNIDIIYCVGNFTFLHALLIKPFIQKKLKIVTCLHHTTPLAGYWKKLQDYIYNYLWHINEKIIFVCKNQMEYWISNNRINRSKCIYIYNSIDHIYYSPIQDEKILSDTRNEIGINNNNFIVGINAVLRPEKMHNDFVDAISECKKTHPNIKGIIIGDGVGKAKLTRHISDMDMTDNIVMVGFKDDVRPYIAICDCMVLTSHFIETFSLSALESQSMGKPVIMTNIGGANELISDQVTGFLFDPGDISKLSLCITQLIDNKEKLVSMKQKSRARVTEHFTLDIMIKKYEQFFISLYET